ncbi:uncharacterized protein Z518_06397 [Rhinocladiella mackenziei CBS 650.93]|uniref:Major facilitator superfamily (MFS) profile domain-containing protein n=1 Tax=Rhinocladiella mackenziei CBS 650.93 TaxID=1442369 RepID=A0A0D2J8U7_9EURO|nr:uncharacterized protein Z518_06397 [Rhinocladiella mackenziei CBS 650.93]KIX05525.1 hypothetical protein Z518_06397 [Rhinocladiella mackenziei CBS 650.93]
MANFKDLILLRDCSWRLLVALVVINVSVFSYGWDNSIYSTVQAMNSFQKKFGSYDDTRHKWDFTASDLAILNSMGLPAKSVGAVLGYIFSEFMGRRISYIAMQTVAIAGTAVSDAATSYGQILAGRMLVQCMVGWDNYLAPMFIAEIVPPQIRGAMVVVCVFMHVFGSFLCTIVTNGTKNYPGDASWQDPVLSGFAFPAFTILFCWLIPESPRWLVRKGKKGRAVRWLNTLNGSKPGYGAEQEATLLQAAIDRDMEMKGRWIDLLKGVNRRTMIAVVSGAFNQLTGQSFVSQYGAIFVKSFNRMDPFVYRVISAAITCAGPIVVFTCVDIVGRRPIYSVAGSIATGLLLAIGALGTGHVTGQRADAIIACSAPFAMFYIMSFGSIAAITGAEVPHLRLRDKTSFLVYFTHFVCDFLVTFTYPYLFDAERANLGAKVGFIYGTFGVLAIVWAFFHLPELTGRSLEEVDEMFEERVPVRKFKTWKSSNAHTMVTDLETQVDHSRDSDIEQAESKNSATLHVEDKDSR